MTCKAFLMTDAALRRRDFTRAFALSHSTLTNNLLVTSARFPDVAAIHFLGTSISYRDFHRKVEGLAGWLQKHAGLKRGDRVALLMQNSPQWLIACYAIFRADLVLVPISPMNREVEVAHYLRDSGARAMIVAQDLAEIAIAASKNSEIGTLIVATYSDYLPKETRYKLPDWLSAGRTKVSGCSIWTDVIDAGFSPEAPCAGALSLCAMPYTSGSTGKPKACMHTHRSLGHNATGLTLWHGLRPGDVSLGAAPMYHVSGFNHAVTGPVYAGASIAIVPRWERDLATNVMVDYGVTHASLAPTAVIDLLTNTRVREFDLSRLRRITAGGAAMPEEVWKRLNETLGLPFIEAYGMTETAATTHLNPIEDPRPHCLGIPFFNTRACIIDAEKSQELAIGEIGEIAVHGPQLFSGYWNRPEATREAFIEIDGRSFYRTGDIGYRDADGFFYMTDRAKRMINASGLKVWPAEVENVLYQHESVLEVCVIAVKDAYRGETVKALIRLRDNVRGRITENDIIGWSRQRMAAYKYPRTVEFVDSLPKSPAGKILWRELQDRENAKEVGLP
ncbi:long-chain-fatty-acid--CoA ligase [Bradyrhizobium sp. WSM1253]|uniref:long-chain-fatty-acid--CoA ligase n=1 Tax=Bradyrhizobium sp. WSM1253 TaxID=319003 RepID=UPI00025D29E0|nr:long-chain-fatty-acid--CoA ligase [Bradyrhizobium sp. WSM1253]EIG61370.1 acyl-CoA synthetase (AMP-forming)/AMP-acid ligase II [Bradyrhizobium sp. WSM1253]